MTAVTFETEKKIAQDILKLLDGVPYCSAQRILDIVTQDAYENSFVEITPIKTCEVNLSTKKLDELIGLIEEFNRNHPAETSD